MKKNVLGLAVLVLAVFPCSASAEVVFRDTFKEGGTLDELHWSVAGQNKTGWAALEEGPFLAISGGLLIPQNDSQGWFVLGVDGWSVSGKGATFSVTLQAPKFVSQSGGGGDYFQIAWFWISDGMVSTPERPSPIQTDRPHFLVKVYQSNGENQPDNLVQVYAKRVGEQSEGTLLWEGHYGLSDDPYPPLGITVTLDESHYTVDFNREMFKTSGSLSGEHGMVFADELHANLGSSNHNIGRGESRFTDFSIVSPSGQ